MAARFQRIGGMIRTIDSQMLPSRAAPLRLEDKVFGRDLTSGAD
jgi:hypothetical protein